MDWLDWPVSLLGAPSQPARAEEARLEEARGPASGPVPSKHFHHMLCCGPAAPSCPSTSPRMPGKGGVRAHPVRMYGGGARAVGLGLALGLAVGPGLGLGLGLELATV